MSLPPVPGQNPPDGGAQQPAVAPYGGGPVGAEPGPYGTAPTGYGAPGGHELPATGPQDGPGAPAANPYTQPGEPGYAPGAPPSTGRTAGWIGVTVLYLLAIWQLVIPTVATFVQSFTAGNPVTGGGEFVGLENWGVVMPQLFPALGVGIVAVLPVTIVAAVLGLVIGAAMTPQQPVAVPTRIAVGVMSALFVPLGIGLSRFLATDSFAAPADARTFLVVTVTLATLPLLTALFATAFAFVLSGTAPGRGVATVIVLGVAGALALGPQLFDIPLVFTGGGPGEATQTPMLLMYRQGFMVFNFGPGAAVSGMVLLLAGALGIVAMLVLLGSRIRLGVADGQPAPARNGSPLGVIGVVVAGIALLAALALHLPVLSGALSSAPDDAPPTMAAHLATWVPAGVGTLLQVGIAVLGGAAIGWCRPAGRRSLWLLLPLAPWLFVGPAPFMLHAFSQFSELGLLNTWFGLFPQPLVVVGAVVVLALVFAGLRERPQRSARAVVGAAGLGAAAVLLITQAQSLLPGLVLNTDPDLANAANTFMRLTAMYGWVVQDQPWVLGLLYPIPMFLLVAALAVLAQLGLRRVVALSD